MPACPASADIRIGNSFAEAEVHGLDSFIVEQIYRTTSNDYDNCYQLVLIAYSRPFHVSRGEEGCQCGGGSEMTMILGNVRPLQRLLQLNDHLADCIEP